MTLLNLSRPRLARKTNMIYHDALSLWHTTQRQNNINLYQPLYHLISQGPVSSTPNRDTVSTIHSSTASCTLLRPDHNFQFKSKKMRRWRRGWGWLRLWYHYSTGWGRCHGAKWQYRQRWPIRNNVPMMTNQEQWAHQWHFLILKSQRKLRCTGEVREQGKKMLMSVAWGGEEHLLFAPAPFP